MFLCSASFSLCFCPLFPQSISFSLAHTVIFLALPFVTMFFVSLSLPRWFPLPQQRWTLTQTTLTHLMSDQTQEADQTGKPNLHQQTAAATWSHSRPSGSFQVSYEIFLLSLGSSTLYTSQLPSIAGPLPYEVKGKYGKLATRGSPVTVA